MTGHTQGEWRLVSESDQPQSLYSGIIAICEHGERRITVVSDGRRVRPAEWEPNGALIAAAPRMLAALEGVVALHRGGPNAVGNWDAAFAECESAIAEARGR